MEDSYKTATEPISNIQTVSTLGIRNTFERMYERKLKKTVRYISLQKLMCLVNCDIHVL